MDDPRKDFFGGFDWKSFEQFFGGKFPLASNDSLKDPSWVDHVVKDVMKQAFTNSVDMNMLNKHYRTEVFETHNNVVVKIHIPDKEQARNLNALVGINQIKLERLPDNRSQVVKLPTHIVPESCKAVYKKGVLQMQIRKVKISERMHEVNVRHYD
ncbi:MAG: HSP20-like chaperone protein [Paenibacillus sp.]|nr:HSP20-like chaperone protein [Paenibacillus sp.]